MKLWSTLSGQKHSADCLFLTLLVPGVLCRLWEDGESRDHWPQDGQGHQAAEAGPLHLWKSAKGEGGGWRRHLHWGQQWSCQGTEPISLVSLIKVICCYGVWKWKSDCAIIWCHPWFGDWLGRLLAGWLCLGHTDALTDFCADYVLGSLAKRLLTDYIFGRQTERLPSWLAVSLTNSATGFHWLTTSLADRLTYWVTS